MGADPLSDREFSALAERLRIASDVLRANTCLMQAIARRYYLVFAHALHAANRHGVTFRRGVEADDGRRITHRALPDLVRALYTGQNSGPVLGNGPGISRPGSLSDDAAHRYADQLHKARIYADYGYTDLVEPYDAKKADERLRWANELVEDLKTLL